MALEPRTSRIRLVVRGAARATRPVRSAGSYALWRTRRKGHDGARRRTRAEIERAWEARRLRPIPVPLEGAVVGAPR